MTTTQQIKTKKVTFGQNNQVRGWFKTMDGTKTSFEITDDGELKQFGNMNTDMMIYIIGLLEMLHTNDWQTRLVGGVQGTSRMVIHIHHLVIYTPSIDGVFYLCWSYGDQVGNFRGKDRVATEYILWSGKKCQKNK